MDGRGNANCNGGMIAWYGMTWYDITTVVHDGDNGVAHGVCDGMMAWYGMA